jgi:hypothetical protein
MGMYDWQGDKVDGAQHEECPKFIRIGCEVRRQQPIGEVAEKDDHGNSRGDDRKPHELLVQGDSNECAFLNSSFVSPPPSLGLRISESRR